MRPMMIVFEGLDGTGKSTLAKLVAEALGYRLMSTPPASWREIRQEVDRMLTNHGNARFAFYIASVALASDEAVECIAAGLGVVVDRYYLSTHAYGCAYAPGLTWPDLETRLRPADITVYLEASETERWQRLQGRGYGREDRLTRDSEYRDRVLCGYRDGLQRPVAGRVLRLDASSSPCDLRDAVISFAREMS